jgi:hypothetical protein
MEFLIATSKTELNWSSPAYSILVPGPAGPMTIFLCLTTPAESWDTPLGDGQPHIIVHGPPGQRIWGGLITPMQNVIIRNPYSGKIVHGDSYMIATGLLGLSLMTMIMMFYIFHGGRWMAEKICRSVQRSEASWCGDVFGTTNFSVVV